ncbi:hypothetical protein C0Q70_02970 [Pomacea canaliculata]|uniref:Phosphatidylcholine transfer protein n=1 Tax=Pomacea canaliculata TaxID=400727 RepID=A0A2T7PRI1_POMCA|nr:hypothetical protein C0Q70_02970 [Pomacea canaliculata]
MAVCFTDEDFVKACLELDQPQVDGWEFFVSSHGVTIYRLYNEVSGLYEYKIFGVLEDILPEICAEVYMDTEYRKQWDSYVNELYETEVDGKKFVYWNVNFPFPLWNRDYVYKRELRVLERQGKKVWVVLAESESTPSIPEKSGVVRVDDYKQCAALTSDGKVGTKDLGLETEQSDLPDFKNVGGMPKMAFMERRSNIILLTTVVMVEVTTATSQDKVSIYQQSSPSTDSASSTGSPAKLLSSSIWSGVTNDSEFNDQTEKKTNYSTGEFDGTEHVTQDGFPSLASAVTLEQSVLTSLQGSFTGDNSTTDMTEQQERTTLDKDEQVSTDPPSTVHDMQSSLSITATDYQPVMNHYIPSRDFFQRVCASDDDTTDTKVEVEYNTTESKPWTKDRNVEAAPSGGDTPVTGHVTHTASGTDPTSTHRTLLADGYSTDATDAGENTTEEAKVVESEARKPTSLINLTATTVVMDASSTHAASMTESSVVETTVSNVAGKTSAMATDFTSETTARHLVTTGELLLTENNSAHTAMTRDNTVTTTPATDDTLTERTLVTDDHMTVTTQVTGSSVTEPILVTEDFITETARLTNNSVTEMALVTDYINMDTTLTTDYPVTEAIVTTDDTISETALVSDDPLTETTLATEDITTETGLHYNLTNTLPVTRDNITDGTPGTHNITDGTPGTHNITDGTPGTHNITDGTPGTHNITDGTPVPTTTTDTKQTTGVASHRISDTTLPRDHVYEDTSITDYVTDTSITNIFVDDTAAMTKDGSAHAGEVGDYSTTEMTSLMTTLVWRLSKTPTSVSGRNISDTTPVVDHSITDTPEVDDKLTDTTLEVDVRSTYTTRTDSVTTEMPAVVIDTSPSRDLSITGRTTEVNSVITNNTVTDPDVTNITKPIGSHTIVTTTVEDLYKNVTTTTTTTTDHNVSSTPSEFHHITETGNIVTATTKSTDHNTTQRALVEHNVTDTTKSDDHSIIETTTIVDHTVENTATAASHSVTHSTRSEDQTVTERTLLDKISTGATLAQHPNVTVTISVDYSKTETTIVVENSTASPSVAHTRPSEDPNITETTVLTDATTAAHYSLTNTAKSGDYNITTTDSIITSETPREHNHTDPHTVLIYATTDKTPVETFPVTSDSFADMELITSTDMSITTTTLGVENNFSDSTETKLQNTMTDISDADAGTTPLSANVSSSITISTSEFVGSEAMTTGSSGLLTGPDSSLEMTTVRVSPQYISESLPTSVELPLHHTSPTQRTATTTGLEPDSYSTLELKGSTPGFENTDDFTAAQETPRTSSEAVATSDTTLQGISEELTSTSAMRPATTTTLHVEVKDTSTDGLRTVETLNSTLEATDEPTTFVDASRMMMTSHSTRVTSGVTSGVTSDTADLPNSSSSATSDEATSTSQTKKSSFSTSEATSEPMTWTDSSGPQWVTNGVTMLEKNTETTMSAPEISSTTEPELAATSKTIIDVSLSSRSSPEVTADVGTASDVTRDSSTLATQTSEVLTLVTTLGASFGNTETSHSGNFSESVDVTKSVKDGISTTALSESSYQTDFRDVSETVDTGSTTEKARDVILTDSPSLLTTSKETLETKTILTSQEATGGLAASTETTLNGTEFFQTSLDLTLEPPADQTFTTLSSTSEYEPDFTSSEPSLRPLKTSESTSRSFTFEATPVSEAVTSEETRGVSETRKTESFWSISSQELVSGYGTTQGSLSDVLSPETISEGVSLHGMTASSLAMSSQKTVSEPTKEPEMNSGSSSEIFTSASQSTIFWIVTSPVPSSEGISNETASDRGQPSASAALVSTESSIPETSSRPVNIISTSDLGVTARETTLELTSGRIGSLRVKH